jgi:predicted nucleic-acid-binding protein
MSVVVGLNTNILARYYVSDDGDAAEAGQREAARRLFESGQPLMVCKTVLLELEWALRGYYGFSRQEIGRVFAHLLAQKHVQVEDRVTVEQAVRNHAEGLDLADALHHASYRDCSAMFSFDDKGFARRSRKLNLTPLVKVPKADAP